MTLLYNSLSAAVLIAVIALIRVLTLHRLPKNTFCVLWTAAALRLLLPFSIESEYSFMTFLRSLFPVPARNPPARGHGRFGNPLPGPGSRVRPCPAA